MIKRIILVALALALAIPAWCESMGVNTQDFQKQTGIEVTHSVDQLLPGYANVGRVVDVDKFKGQGFKDATAGEFVKFFVRDDGSIKIVLDSTGEASVIQVAEGK